MKKTSFLQAAISTTVMLVLFKLLGFVKQAVIAYYFGTTFALDSYYVALGFLDSFVFSVAEGLGVGTLSVYTTVRITEGRERAGEAIQMILSCFLPLSALVSGIMLLLAAPLAHLLAPSYTAAERTVLTSMLRWVSPLFCILVATSLLCAVLNSEKQFHLTRLESFFRSSGIILCILLFSSTLSTYSLILGDYISIILFALLLFIVIKKNYLKLSFSVPTYTPEVKQVLHLAIPLMIGDGMIRLNEMVDRILATNIGEGNVSALSYCQVLTQFVTYLVIINIGNILFAEFSNLAAEGKTKEISETLERTLKTLVYLLIPVSIITVFCAKDIVKIVYYRGSFDETALRYTAAALVGYAISFPVMAVRDILTKSMYAYQNTKAPMVNGAVSIVINIALSIMLSLRFGIIGIALGTSISAVVTMILNMCSFRRILPEFSYRRLGKAVLYSLPSIVFTTLAVVFFSHRISNPLLSFLISACTGFVLFFVGLQLTGAQDFKAIVHSLAKRKT